MWILRRCNWREFCNTADEHHAVCLGALIPFFMWPFVTKHCPDAVRLLDIEPWYIALGMSLRVLSYLLIGWWLL